MLTHTYTKFFLHILIFYVIFFSLARLNSLSRLARDEAKKKPHPEGEA